MTLYEQISLFDNKIHITNTNIPEIIMIKYRQQYSLVLLQTTQATIMNITY